MTESTKRREITGEDLGGEQDAIERICRMAGLSVGDSLIVEWQEELCIYHYEDKADRSSEGSSDEDGEENTNAIHNCPAEVCKNHREEINTLCHELGKSPGSVIVRQYGGKFCICRCG